MVSGKRWLLMVALAAQTFGSAYGQLVRDSLTVRLRNATSIEQKVSALIDLSQWYMLEDFSLARQRADQAIKLSKNLDSGWYAKALTQRAKVFWQDGMYDSSIYLNRRSLSIRKARRDSSGMAENEFAIAMCYYYSADYDSAIQYHSRAYERYLLLKNLRQAAEILNLTAMAYHLQGNYPRTIEYLYKFANMRDSLKGYNGRTYNLGSTTPYFMTESFFRNELNVQFSVLEGLKPADEVTRLSIYLNIADCYKELRDYSNALRYHKIASRYAKTIGARPELNYIGNAYRALGQLDSAVAFHQKAINKKDFGSRLELLYAYSSMGKDLVDMKNFDQALTYFRKALSLTTTMHNKLDEVIQAIRIAEMLSKLNRPKAAEWNALLALHRAGQIKAMTFFRDANMLVARIKAQQGEYDSAYYYQLAGRIISDSLVRAESKLQYSQMQAQFESNRKQKDIEILNREKEIQTHEIRNKNLLIAVVVLFLSIAILLLMLIYWQSRRQAKSNRILNQQKERIELLLSEIHHRVKNNLQVISSLLSLQSNKLSDRNAKMAVMQGQSRVQAMGLIHECIYKSDNFNYINMDDYLRRLSRFLCESFDMTHVSVSIATSPVSLDVDTAVPLGMIVNELVTNSLKHAFKGVPFPAIEISLDRISGHRIEMKVNDNGIGLIGPLKSHSFGLKLVRELTKQLGGSVSFHSQNGLMTEVYITKFSMDNRAFTAESITEKFRA